MHYYQDGDDHLDGNECRWLASEEVLDESILANQWHRVGIMSFEKVDQLAGRCQLLEDVERHE